MVGVVLVGDHPLVWGRSATWGTGNGAGSFIRKLCFCCGCAEVFGSGKFIRRNERYVMVSGRELFHYWLAAPAGWPRPGLLVCSQPNPSSM